MQKFEIWIDIVHRGNGHYETLCTLFGQHEFAVRPQIGEILSFSPPKGSAIDYSVVSNGITIRLSSVRVTIEEIEHYTCGNGTQIRFETAVRCSEISVDSKEDGLIVYNFMTQHMNFEIDPYGINKLDL